MSTPITLKVVDFLVVKNPKMKWGNERIAKSLGCSPKTVKRLKNQLKADRKRLAAA